MAPANGTITVDTFGSSFDTLLTVATGQTVSGLTMLAQNDNADGVLQSRVTLNVFAGATYQFAVDGVGSATGDIELGLIWRLRRR